MNSEGNKRSSKIKRHTQNTAKQIENTEKVNTLQRISRNHRSLCFKISNRYNQTHKTSKIRYIFLRKKTSKSTMIVAALNIAWVAIASSFVAPTHEQLDEQQTRDVVWSRSRALTSRLYTTSRYFPTFLPERDYITFGSLLSQFRLSSVCRLWVCNVAAPYWGGWTFRQNFFTAVYAGHPLTFVKNFTEIVPGEPLYRER